MELLFSQWQSEDCTLPIADQELADLSGLGDDLWETHKERILRNFMVTDGIRYVNLVCLREWQEAKRIFEARRSSALRTVTVRSPSRRADTITGTGTYTETERQKPLARATRLPSEWAPNLVHQNLAVELGVGIATEAEKFRDYWAAKAGAGGRKLDWDATFRNWLRTAAERSNGHGRPDPAVGTRQRELSPEYYAEVERNLKGLQAR